MKLLIYKYIFYIYIYMTSYTYKNANNNIIMHTNVCQNCEILNARITCLEYDNDDLKHENLELKEDNKFLKNEIIELKEDNIILKEDNKNLKEEIIELKHENKNLKEEIIELKHENKNLKEEIIELKHENKNLKEEIIELKHENKNLKEEIIELKHENKNLKDKIIILENENIKLKFDKIKNKLLTAIQDINKNDQLEKKYNFLYRIRKYRNNINHYINEEFDTNENIINYKKLLLKNKLLQLSEEEINIFNKRYNINNLVNIILEYLNTLDLYYDNLDEDDIIDANNWWLD